MERLIAIGWVRKHKSIRPMYQINLENERVDEQFDLGAGGIRLIGAAGTCPC